MLLAETALCRYGPPHCCTTI